jgi:hydrogenase nickel incorporation protein HypA/HybF
MHEFSLINDLMRKIAAIAHEQSARRVVGVKVTLGALSHISPDHFREHFEAAATGTIAQDAMLDIETLTDEHDPHAQDILLDSVEVED